MVSDGQYLPLDPGEIARQKRFEPFARIGIEQTTDLCLAVT